MNHHDFAFDDTFGESANNAEVYEGTARQLVLDALEGKQGTVMMWPGYGWDVGDGMGMVKSYILIIYTIFGGMMIQFPSIVHQGTKGCDLLRCESEMLLPVGIVGVWMDLEPHFISNVI